MTEKVGLPEESGELFEHFRFTVDKGQNPDRIDRYLSHKIENASRTRIQHATEAGNVLVNDRPVRSNYRVRPMDVITIVLAYPPRDTEIHPENIPVNVLYEDREILVVNKPAGMVVHPGHGNFSGTLVNALLYHLLHSDDEPSRQCSPFLVHRIDKDTSGILLVAKNELSQSKLARQFYYHTVERTYAALVWGDIGSDEGTITGNIDRDVRNRLVFAVSDDPERGRHAVSHYRVLERFGYVTLVECRLETGRTHQIRVHFSHIRHPLFNDESYGGNKILKGTTFSKYRQFVENCFEILPRQALHAKTLAFDHPVTGERMRFDTDYPEDLATVIGKWRGYTTNETVKP